MAVLSPEVTWAQRSSPSDPSKNVIFLTIVVSDVPESNLTLDLTPTKLSYKAKTTKGQEYAVEIEFFEEIDTVESRKLHNGRATECVIRKKTPKQEFWPRLTKDKVRYHWLKTDFDKWADEDEQDGPAPEPEFDPSMMSQFGGGGGGDEAGGFGGIDFSKLGGGADMSGLGGPGLEDDSDDEDMPDLEGEDKKDDQMALDNEPLKTDKGKGKIEELD